MPVSITLKQDARTVIEVADEKGEIVFRDALYHSSAELADLKEGQLEAMAQARYDGWKEAIARPPAPTPEPTEEQKETALEDKLREFERLQSELALESREKLDATTMKLGIVSMTFAAADENPVAFLPVVKGK